MQPAVDRHWAVAFVLALVAGIVRSARVAHSSPSRHRAAELAAGAIWSFASTRPARPSRDGADARRGVAADSTRVIPLTLNEAIDPRNVQRFSLYYRAANPLSPPWQVVAADVDLSAGREPQQLLLDTTLSGEIARQGELATLTATQHHDLHERCGLRRSKGLQRNGTLRASCAGRRCPRLCEPASDRSVRSTRSAPRAGVASGRANRRRLPSPNSAPPVNSRRSGPASSVDRAGQQRCRPALRPGARTPRGRTGRAGLPLWPPGM